MNKRYKFSTIDDVNRLYNIPTLHPLISVIKLSDVKPIDIHHSELGIYTIACYINDDGSGSVHFFAPTNNITLDTREFYRMNGYSLNFHPSLLDDTLLVHRMSEYPFFKYAPHDVLHLSDYDMRIVVGCINGIGIELKNTTDNYTTRIIASGMAVLFSFCMRYYDREYSAHSDSSDIVKRLNMLLNNHLARPIHERCELPTVAWCAERMHLSANYFGDLVKRQSHRSAQDIIHQRIIAEARLLLDRGRYSISEISYHLGFKYPHHLTRVFKRILGITPNEYRAKVQIKKPL